MIRRRVVGNDDYDLDVRKDELANERISRYLNAENATETNRVVS